MKKNHSEKYYNDPDIVNEPKAMREIHAIRLMDYEESKSMTDEEYMRKLRENANAVLKERGINHRKK